MGADHWSRVGTAIGLCVAVVVAGIVGCQSDMPGIRPAPPTPAIADDAPLGTTERFAEDRTPGGVVPRGRWEMRLWIGIWCDRSGRRGDPSFRVEVDGIEMMETRSTCRAYRPPPNSEPNAGYLGFTLGEGVHTLTLIPPVGEPYSQRIVVEDDTWAIVHYAESDGQPEVEIRTQVEQLAVDGDYDPATRPLPPEQRDRVAQAQEVAHDASAGELVAGGSAIAPAPGVSVEEWLATGAVDRAPNSDEGERRSGRSGHSRDRDDNAGWVEGTPGYLAVESPRPVRVWVDGQSLGAAPIRRHMLGAGEHRVVLRGDGGFERSFEIEVEPNRTYHLVNEQ